jgi:hypothetical protein
MEVTFYFNAFHHYLQVTVSFSKTEVFFRSLFWPLKIILIVVIFARKSAVLFHSVFISKYGMKIIFLLPAICLPPIWKIMPEP